MYKNNSEEIFDIKHVLYTIANKKDNKLKKYDEYITHIGFQKNEDGGYIIRHLITKDNLFKLATLINSKKYKHFGELYNQNKKYQHRSIEKDLLIKSCIDNPEINNNDDEETRLIKNLIKNKIELEQYENKHLAYMYLLPFREENGNELILIKIGYTYEERDLENEYKCPCYLVNVKIINAQRDEKKFHKEIKKKISEMYYPVIINGKPKEETYKLHERVINYFDNYKILNLEQLELEKYKIHEETVRLRLQLQSQEKTKRLKIIEKEKTKRYKIKMRILSKNHDKELDLDTSSENDNTSKSESYSDTEITEINKIKKITHQCDITKSHSDTEINEIIKKSNKVENIVMTKSIENKFKTPVNKNKTKPVELIVD